MRVIRSPIRRVTIACVVILAACTSRTVWADGWHNPVLELPSVNDWLQDAQQAFPDLQDQLKSSTLQASNDIEKLKNLNKNAANSKPSQQTLKKGQSERPLRGGTLQVKLNQQQQALLARKANDCLEVLAFMKNGNIYPREFPNCSATISSPL